MMLRSVVGVVERTLTHTRPTTQVNAYDLIPLCLSMVLKVCEGAPTFLPRGACLRFVPRCSDTLGASTGEHPGFRMRNLRVSMTCTRPHSRSGDEG